MLLPETNLPAAIEIAERLRQTVAQPIFNVLENTPINLTLSIGVANLKKTKRQTLKSFGMRLTCIYTKLNL